MSTLHIGQEPPRQKPDEAAQLRAEVRRLEAELAEWRKPYLPEETKKLCVALRDAESIYKVGEQAADMIETLTKSFSEGVRWRPVPAPQMARAMFVPVDCGTVYTKRNGQYLELVLPPLPEAPK